MLNTAFIIAFMVYFVKATTWKGMIFHNICNTLEGIPEKIKKPLYDCPICMTPWWGTLIYIIGHYTHLPQFEVLSFPQVIFTIFTAGGINTIVLVFNHIYDIMHKQQEEKENGQI